MNTTVQIFAAAALIIVPAMIMAIFWKVASEKGSVEDYKKIAEKGYAIRGRYFRGLLAVSAVFIVIGIYAFPYPRVSEAKTNVTPYIVKAKASQFSFELSKTSIPLGHVRFDVTSTDVNHGFGIYDDNGNLVSQTQAMPDYVNRLYVNFEKPGKYHVWCLEYCGVAHHVMSTDFEVI